MKPVTAAEVDFLLANGAEAWLAHRRQHRHRLAGRRCLARVIALQGREGTTSAEFEQMIAMEDELRAKHGSPPQAWLDREVARITATFGGDSDSG